MIIDSIYFHPLCLLVGEIVSIGPNCELELQVGQRVLALLSGGGYAEYASVDERSVLPFPENLSVEEVRHVILIISVQHNETQCISNEGRKKEERL